ncbi:ATP-binding protein [Tropicibacter oceani]|uniref:histidine kinase n=1 Tax=Tropicibacter oceani TaxID=3058420 RepID=A0ABY8QL79_9RHOB|nr:ATP-binding protein [Tropicibacter oceani]WGW05203.1 ATP-binding protein [Tropicibacter oceani]
MKLSSWIRDNNRMLRAVFAVCLAGSLAAILFVREQQRATDREAELYSVNSALWKISELIYETERLSGVLLAYAIGDDTQQGVALRFDILWSRTDVLSVAAGERTLVFAQVIQGYSDFLKAEEPAVFGDAPLSDADVDRMRGQLQVLSHRARSVWSEAMADKNTALHATQIADRRQGLYYRTVTAAMIGLLMLFVVIEIFSANRDRNREMRLHEAAAQSSAAKSRFLANISHEIRTPLNGILSMATELAETDLDADQRRCVDVIEQSGGLLLSTINDVLDLSKVEAGQFHIEAHAFDLRTLLNAAASLYSASAREKGLELSVETDSSVPGLVRGDGRRLRQVLNNLIANAVKFTPTGQVLVRALVDADPGLIRIEVRDTGPGIPAEAQERIFEPFTQADTSITRVHGGTGLGLTISRQLCVAMGGTLSLASDLGKGAVFSCVLPLPAVEVPKPVQADSPRAAPSDLSGMRILVVDDNATNRLILDRFIKPTGAVVTQAENGAEAVAALREARFDLVLMDIQMPVMDGVAATREIRAEEAASGRPATPVIGVTANVLSHQVDEYHAAGMDHVLPKPASKKALWQVLDSCLGRRDAA